MPKFLHTADWQIGEQFGSFDKEIAPLLIEARLETVARIADLAKDRKVDAVLVAGDVFDSQVVHGTTIRRLFASLTAFSGPWVLLPGNHDAALAEGVWAAARRFNCIPSNVTVVTRTGSIDVPGTSLTVLAAPLTQRHTYDDVTAEFDQFETSPGSVRVGLAHGSISGYLFEEVDSRNPIAASRAATARLDYLALGDWHGTLNLDERTWYAGTPEQDQFKGNDTGNVLEVSIDAPGAIPAVTAHRVGRFRWHALQQAITVPSDIAVLAERLKPLGLDDVVNLTVTGVVTLAQSELLDEVVENARARLRLRVDTGGVHVTASADELATLAAKGGYLAGAVERLQAMQADPGQGRAATEALRMLAQIQRQAGATA